MFYAERTGWTGGCGFGVDLAVADGTWYCCIGCGVPYLKNTTN